MKKQLLTLGLAALFCLPMGAQIKLKGIGINNRYDDGDQMKTTWIGSLYDENGNYTGKTAFIVDEGIYALNVDVAGKTVSTPVKEPAVNLSDIKQGSQVDYEKALWATNFNLMHGNSGAVYIDGQLATIMSRDESSNEDDELFALRWWDANTGNLVYSKYGPKSLNVENAGLSYNPVDGKVYGLFYITEADLPDEIKNDEDYFESEADPYQEASGTDAGYALGTIDLQNMTIDIITPGLYYYNFVGFAINSEGRAFGLTSGGSGGYIDDGGKQRTINGELAGAQLFEFNLQRGTYYANATVGTDEDGEEEITYTPCFKDGTAISATGYSSQYRRQSMCFAKSNPNVIYWNGYYNSGKGLNEWNSWSSLSDKEWRTNGKYDTCIYAIDITTGEAERVAKIPNRWTFSCLWADGDDNSDGSGLVIYPEDAPTAISSVNAAQGNGTEIFTISGQRTNTLQKGISIVKSGNSVKKVLNK